MQHSDLMGERHKNLTLAFWVCYGPEYRGKGVAKPFSLFKDIIGLVWGFFPLIYDRIFYLHTIIAFYQMLKLKSIG